MANFNVFNSVKIPKNKRNRFDLSHTRLQTTDLGLLTPVLCQRVAPGDTWKVRTELLVKMQPLAAPIMSNLNAYIHYFFVPNRLIWDEFEVWRSNAGLDPDTGELIPYPTIPVIQLYPNGIKNNSLADYLGFPEIEAGANQSSSPLIDLLPFRAYQLIYNEYYRDENLSEPVQLTDISDKQKWQELGKLRYRAWKKDYFTSALPWTQRGADVHLPANANFGSLAGMPLGQFNDITLDNPKFITNQGIQTGGQNVFLYPDGSGDQRKNDMKVQNSDGDRTVMRIDSDTEQVVLGTSDTSTILTKALQYTGTTINELRRALAVQRWSETSARVGARYKEFLLGFFGVHNSDSRLQRPQYLGGGKQNIVINEILQTSETANTPQGHQTGVGLSLGSSNGFKHTFTEDGFIIGIMSIIPDALYYQGIPRQFLVRDSFDLITPQFAHLGEQPVYNQELFYTQNNNELNEKTFGYQPRYTEYRFIPDTVHGDFRSSMDFWHLGRKFDKLPNLNEDFIKVKPEDADDIFPVEANAPSQNSENPGRFYCQLYSHIEAKRQLPKYGTPSIL